MTEQPEPVRETERMLRRSLERATKAIAAIDPLIPWDHPARRILREYMDPCTHPEPEWMQRKWTYD